MSIRKFTLTNSKGTTWSFNGRNTVKSFIQNPEGLGFASSLNVTRYGEKANLTSQEYDLPRVKAEVVFWDVKNANRYKTYNDFLAFIMNTPLILTYQLPLSTPVDYKLDCYVVSISKTETGRDNCLTSEIEFQGLSFWQGAAVSTTGTATSYTITNAGDCPVGFEITITGTSMENPYFTLEQDSELYGEAKFTDISAFDSVYVNSNDGEQSVELQQGGSVLANPLAYQDLSISNGAIYVTFVKLARGKSTLTIGMDSGSISSVTIEYTPIYRSV